MEEVQLSNRIINGLKQYDLSLKEIEKSSWTYCGGDREQHLRYWNVCQSTRKLLNRKEWPQPPHESHCVCGHAIQENCYITNGKYFLIVGNSCIKKFTTAGRQCELCKESHKSKKDNLCKKCRRDRCKIV